MSVSPLAPPASSQPRITLRRTASGSAASWATSSPPPVPTLGQRPRGELVEGVGVLAQRSRGAGQRFGDPAAEHLLQQRQHLDAQPRPGEPAIGVVRVLPRRQAKLGTGRVRNRAADAQQRAAPGRVAWPHARDRPRPRSAAQPEQHRLGLVVERVREQDRSIAARAVERT